MSSDFAEILERLACGDEAGAARLIEKSNVRSAAILDQMEAGMRDAFKKTLDNNPLGGFALLKHISELVEEPSGEFSEAVIGLANRALFILLWRFYFDHSNEQVERLREGE